MLALRLEVKIVNEKFKVASASQARKFLNYCEFYSKVIIHCVEARCSRDGTGRSHRAGLTYSQNEIEILQKISEIQEPAPKVPPPLLRAGPTFLGPGSCPPLHRPTKKCFMLFFTKYKLKIYFYIICFLTKNFSHLSKIAKAKAIDESANMQLCVKGRCFAPRALS